MTRRQSFIATKSNRPNQTDRIKPTESNRPTYSTFSERCLNFDQNEVEMVNCEHEKNRIDDVWRTNQVKLFLLCNQCD